MRRNRQIDLKEKNLFVKEIDVKLGGCAGQKQEIE